MYIPESIRRFLPSSEYDMDRIGRSQASVLVFEGYVLKVETDSITSQNEHQMMKWLQGRLPVPQIIAEELFDGRRYLLMSRMKGEYLCTASMLDDQERLAQLVAEGLKTMWNVDVSSCPTQRTLERKFLEIETGLRNGTITRETASQTETYGAEGFESPEQLFDWLVKHRPKEELVLSHGDFCLPNIFAANGKISGFIDLGQVGIADKWVDIEQVLWSMWANTTGVFGGAKRQFDSKLLFRELGLSPNDEKLRYYSLLNELC